MERLLDNDAQIAPILLRKIYSESIPHTDAAPVETFYIGDAFKTTEELRAKGVKCDDVRAVPGMVVLGRFYDPEGNIFDLAG